MPTKPSAPKKIRPSSGIGQFIAQLDQDVLKVTLPVAFVLVPGDPALVPGLATDEYQWTSAAGADFAKTFQQEVGDAWSRQFDIEGTDNSCRIEVAVEVEEVKLSDALWRVFVSHYPLDAQDTDASVCDPGSSHDRGGCLGNPTGQDWGTVQLARTHLEPEYVQSREIAPIEIAFPRGGAKPVSEAWINRAITWLPREPGWRVRLEGYADLQEVASDGTEFTEELQQRAHTLSRERVAHLATVLRNAGVASKRIRKVAYGTPEDDSPRQRVDLTVSKGERQDTLAHEAGHMLGLGDEAVTEPAFAGDPLLSADYAAAVYWYTGQLIRRHDDEGMMSRGSTVRFWHYTPFLEALEILTGSYNWQIVPRPDGPVDERFADYSETSCLLRPRPAKVS